MPRDLTRDASGQVSQRDRPLSVSQATSGGKEAQSLDRAPAPLLLMQVSQRKSQQGA